MTINPLVLEAIAAATRLTLVESRYPVTTDLRSGPGAPPNAPPTAGQIPSFLRSIASALLGVAEASATASTFSVQQEFETPVEDVNWLRFLGGASLTDEGNNVVAVDVGSVVDPGLALTPVLAASTADVPGTFTVDAGGPFKDQLSNALTPAIDGVVAWTLNDRILLKDQATISQNGVYRVISTAAPWVVERVSDYCGSQTAGRMVQSVGGTANNGLVWQQTSPDTSPVVVGGAAGASLVFTQYPVPATTQLLEVSVGARGAYPTLEDAILAFASGEWGDGVDFRVLLTEASSSVYTTNWTGLPATVECLYARSAAESTQAGRPTIVFQGPFPGDVYVDGVNLGIDATHICGRAANTRLALLNSEVGVAGATTQYDLIRTDAVGRVLMVNAAARSYDRVQATTAGVTADGSVTGSDAVLVRLNSLHTDMPVKCVGHDMEFAEHAQLRLLTGTNISGATFTFYNGAATDSFTVADGASITNASVFIRRQTGGTDFSVVCGEAFLDGCRISVVDDANVAGFVTFSGTGAGAAIRNLQYPSNTATGTIRTTAGGWTLNFADGFWMDGFDATSTASTVGDLEITANAIKNLTARTDGAVTLDVQEIQNVLLACDGVADTYEFGRANDLSSYTESIDLNLGNAAGYQVNIFGHTILNVNVAEAEDSPDATRIVIGDPLTADGPTTNQIAGVQFAQGRNGATTGPSASLRAIDVSGVNCYQRVSADERFNILEVYCKNVQNVMFNGAQLDVYLQGITYDPPVTDQAGTVSNTYSSGNFSVRSAPSPSAVSSHMIDGLMVEGVANFIADTGLTVDLHLSNSQFSGAVPTFNSVTSYRNVVVCSTISEEVADPIVASGTKAIGVSVTNIS